MAITFADAREAVRKASGKAPGMKGFEDEKHYNVVLVEPELNDLVYLVNKSSGEVTTEYYFIITDKLDKMQLVVA